MNEGKSAVVNGALDKFAYVNFVGLFREKLRANTTFFYQSLSKYIPSLICFTDHDVVNTSKFRFS